MDLNIDWRVIMLFDIRYSKKLPFIHISKESLFGVLFEFIIVGILGFILETVLEYITQHTFIDRGFLCGPFIPIYGVFIGGMCLINKFPKRNLKNYIFLSAIIFVASYIFEEIIGCGCELIFNTKLWQYSSWMPFNSNSRYTNLIVSICWGLGGAAYYLIAIPLIYKLSKKISSRVKIAISIEFGLLFIFDIIYTLVRISINHGYYILWYYKASTELTLFIIGIFFYLIVLVLLMEFISKEICKLNKRLDSLMFVLSTFIILLPFFSAYDYLQRSGKPFLEALSALGFIDVGILIYFALFFILFFGLLYLYKLCIYLIEKKKKVDERLKIYKNYKTRPILISLCFFSSIIVIIIGILSVKNPATTNISIGSGEKNLNIVVVSDIHYGTTGNIVDMNDLVNDLNSKNADVIFFLGDTIDKYASNESSKGKDYLDYTVFAEYMKNIKSTYGIYDISGNHEFETNSLTVVNSFFHHIEELAPNFHYLDNEAVVVADAFRLVGRRDYYFGGRSNSRESIESILRKSNLQDSNLDLIVLDHQPQDFRDSLNSNAILQLSGHTHNGQIFPGDIIISLYHKIRYGCISYGLYNEGNFNLFVTRGYGAWGFPLRTSGASEILIIDYRY